MPRVVNGDVKIGIFSVLHIFLLIPPTENKALHKQIKTFSGRKFLILNNIPHVLVSLFESSRKYHFQFRWSSRRRFKNLTDLILLIHFSPIFNSKSRINIDRGRMKDYVFCLINI